MASRTGSMTAGWILAALVAAGATGFAGCDNGHASAAPAQDKKDQPAKTPAKEGEKPKDEPKPAPKEGEKDAKTGNELMSVPVGGKTFKLELALTNDVRMKGLGQRNEIAADGGMLFGFKDSDVRVQKFVMRDCPVDIDIIYLDGAGRILAMYQMKAEPRKADGSDGDVGDFEGKNPKSMDYERRLKSYSSRFPSQFVIELKGGTLPSLKLKEGDKIDADWAGLKKRCK